MYDFKVFSSTLGSVIVDQIGKFLQAKFFRPCLYHCLLKLKKDYIGTSEGLKFQSEKPGILVKLWYWSLFCIIVAYASVHQWFIQESKSTWTQQAPIALVRTYIQTVKYAKKNLFFLELWRIRKELPIPLTEALRWKTARLNPLVKQTLLSPRSHHDSSSKDGFSPESCICDPRKPRKCSLLKVARRRKIKGKVQHDHPAGKCAWATIGFGKSSS